MRKQERWWRDVDAQNKLLFRPPPGAPRLPSGGSKPEQTDVGSTDVAPQLSPSSHQLKDLG